MKKLIMLFILATSSLVHADEIRIFDESYYILGYNSSVDAKFAMNEELGRAWVSVIVTDNDPESYQDEYRVKIDGLIYDKEREALVYLHDETETVCGNYIMKGKSIFKRKIFKLTGKCQFRGEWKKYSYDNGYEIKKGEKYIIDFIYE